MVNLNRRSFLGGALALAVTPVLAPLAASLPVIYGDLKHDDWAGLQAMMDGQSFRIEDEDVRASEGALQYGMFTLSRKLVIRRNDFRMDQCYFASREDFEGSSLIEVNGTQMLYMSECILDVHLGEVPVALKIIDSPHNCIHDLRAVLKDGRRAWFNV